MGPEAMTRLCVSLGYDNANIKRMLTTVHHLSERDADNMIARVREHRLSADEEMSTL